MLFGDSQNNIFGSLLIGHESATVPAAPLEVYSASAAQFRLTRTLASVYADLSVNGSGDLTLAPTSGLVTMPANNTSNLQIYNVSSVNTTTQLNTIYGYGYASVAAISQTAAGTDTGFVSNNYVAAKFNSGSFTRLRSVTVRLKATAGSTPGARIAADIYTDVAGVPGTKVTTLNGHYIQVGLIATTTTAYELQIENTSTLTASTDYWLVLRCSSLSTGTVSFGDKSASGGANFSSSTDGTTWDAATNFSFYYQLWPLVAVGVRGHSSSNTGVSGTSGNSYAGLFSSTYGVGASIAGGLGGLVAGSVHGYGAYIYSTDSYAAHLIQQGTLAGNNTSAVLNVSRQATLGGFTSTGALFYVNDASGSTGDLASFNVAAVAKLRIDSVGKLFASSSIELNNATSNLIQFGTNGVAAPTFTTRSAGTKATLYNSLAGAAVDYALGIESGAMWFSTATTSNSFKWYGGITLAATLSGAGLLTLVGGLSATTGTFSSSVSATSGTFSSTITVTGAAALNGGATITNSDPRLYWYDTDATADERRFDIVLQAGTTSFRYYTDAGGGAYNWLNVARSGSTATTIAFTSSTSMTYNGANVSTGSGTNAYVARWSGSATLVNSIIRDDGTTVAINNTPAADKKLLVTNTVNTTTTHAYGIEGQSYSTVADAVYARMGVAGRSTASHTTGTQISIRGLYGTVMADGSGGTTTTAAAFWTYVQAHNSHTIGSGVGLYVDTMNATSGGVITNLYGIYIASQSAGTSSNYAIYAAGDNPVYFRGSLTCANGLVSLTHGTSNRITWGAIGLAAPAFTTYSAGTKLVLYDSLSGANAGFTIGAESGSLWSTVGTTSNSFKWYGGTTLAATLTGAGALTLVGALAATTGTFSSTVSCTTLTHSVDVKRSWTTWFSSVVSDDTNTQDSPMADMFALAAPTGYDVLRYRTISAFERWNGSAWSSQSDPNTERMFDGRNATRCSIITSTDYTTNGYTQARFTVDLGGDYVRPQMFLIQRGWNSSYYAYTVTIEQATSLAPSTWTTLLAATSVTSGLFAFRTTADGLTNRYLRFTFAPNSAVTAGALDIVRIMALGMGTTGSEPFSIGGTGLGTFTKQLTLSVAGGTAPLAITSTTVCTNLNSDLLDGQHGSYYQSASNLNAGTLPDARFPATLPALSGVNLTALNASNLTSGTVASARISGSYTGITTVGTLTTLVVDSGQITVRGTSSGFVVARRDTNAAAWQWYSAAGELGLYDHVLAANRLTVTQSTGLFTINGAISVNGQVTSTLADGTAPFVVTSTTLVANLNVGRINGVLLTGLGTGIVKNTTGTGVFSIAVAGDFPTLNQNTSGTAAGLSATLVATSGGTGFGTYAVGDILYASSTTALSKLTAGISGYVLTSGGPGVAPSWVASAGGMGGSGSTNAIPKFSASTTLADSSLSDDGTWVTSARQTRVSGTSPWFALYETDAGTDLKYSSFIQEAGVFYGRVYSDNTSSSYNWLALSRNSTPQVTTIALTSTAAFTYNGNAVLVSGGNLGTPASGDGSNLTALNATSLASGTVNTARLSGSYSGITGLGTLGALTVSGVLTSTQSTGTAPLSVSSTTTCVNLNADLLDDQQGSFYRSASNVNAGLLAGTYGGTNNGYMQFSGPNTSLKTFTLPNASSTIATGTGTASYVPRWLSTDGTMGNSVIQDNGSRVGIGGAPDGTYIFKVTGQTQLSGRLGVDGPPDGTIPFKVNGNSWLAGTVRMDTGFSNGSGTSSYVIKGYTTVNIGGTDYKIPLYNDP